MLLTQASERILRIHHTIPLWSRHYQYAEYYDDTGEIVFREYYDLVHDRWQLVNLLHDGNPSNDPDVGPLHDRLTADRSCVATTCP